jgi:hypothetical protein
LGSEILQLLGIMSLDPLTGLCKRRLLILLGETEACRPEGKDDETAIK